MILVMFKSGFVGSDRITITAPSFIPTQIIVSEWLIPTHLAAVREYLSVFPFLPPNPLIFFLDASYLLDGFSKANPYFLFFLVFSRENFFMQMSFRLAEDQSLKVASSEHVMYLSSSWFSGARPQTSLVHMGLGVKWPFIRHLTSQDVPFWMLPLFKD